MSVVRHVDHVPRALRSTMVASSLLLVVALVPTSAGADTRPGQVITVQASTARSRVAVLRTWQLQDDGRYVQVFAPIVAHVGVNGVRPTREGLGRTPVGIFTLTEAFGSQATNGTRLPYVRVGPDDWWDEYPASPRYNEMVRSAHSPGGDSENLLAAGTAYDHAVVINYNTDPVVKGAGSGFFLHVSVGEPTEGCVAISYSALNDVMRWLTPVDDPVISIGVGASTRAIVEPSS